MMFRIPYCLCLAILSQMLGVGVSSFQTSLDSSPLASPMASSKKDQVQFRTVLMGHDDENSTMKENTALLISEETIEVSEEKKQQRALVLTVGLGALAAVALAAATGVLPQYEATNELIARDISSSLLTGVLGYVFVKMCTWLASKEMLEPRDSRKIIHTLSAPLFMLFWPCFSAQPGARFFAAVVPLVNALRLYLASTGQESELANAVSRSGNVKEAIEGPFIYVVILFSCILGFWRDLPSVVALSAMAAGDGMADLLGRRLGQGNKWPFSPDKSIAGSAAFVTFSAASAMGLAYWLQLTNCLEISQGWPEFLLRVAAIMTTCAIIELQPLGDDNWTVPVSAAILAVTFL